MWKGLWYQYEFIYAGKLYTGQFDTPEHAKDGAMIAIDEILSERSHD